MWRGNNQSDVQDSFLKRLEDGQAEKVANLMETARRVEMEESKVVKVCVTELHAYACMRQESVPMLTESGRLFRFDLRRKCTTQRPAQSSG